MSQILSESSEANYRRYRPLIFFKLFLNLMYRPVDRYAYANIKIELLYANA